MVPRMNTENRMGKRDNAGEMKACRLRGKLRQNQIYSRKARSVLSAARTSHFTESVIFKAV